MVKKIFRKLNSSKILIKNFKYIYTQQTDAEHRISRQKEESVEYKKSYLQKVNSTVLKAPKRSYMIEIGLESLTSA